MVECTCEKKTVPHQHAETIKAWADGQVIEFKSIGEGEWSIIDNPNWYPYFEYRIKPEPKPDVVRYARTSGYNLCEMTTPYKEEGDNLKLTFDSETGKLKSAEVIA